MIAEQQQSRDPWAHRSAGMRCKTCMWWVAKAQPRSAIGELQRAAYNPVQSAGLGLGIAAGLGAQAMLEKVETPQEPERVLGRCRRHAPTMNGFPAAWSGDWCGDHKLDETKV